MQVLHVAPYFPPTWAFGGIPRVLDGLGRAQVEAGARVRVFTTDVFDKQRRNGLAEGWDHHGIGVYNVPNLSNRLASGHQLFLPSPRGIAKLQRALDESPPDVIHLHGHRHLLNNIGLAWSRRYNAPLVMTAHGTLIAHERKVGLKYLWDLGLGDPVVRAVNAFVALSAADVAAHRGQGIPAERIHRIPNGLDFAEYEPLAPRGQFRTRLGLGQRPIVSYLGQISPRKGVDHLITAFASGKMAPAVLLVAGNDAGGLSAEQARSTDDIRFLGVLEGQERLALLADTDVLVYASTAEVFGLVPFEGLLCGAPVVVAADCGCGELIAEAGAGLLVRHGDISGLQARIRTLLHDREAAQAMVGRGRRYIREKLDFHKTAAAHLALYDQLQRATHDGS